MGKRGPGVRWSYGVSTKMSRPNDLDWSKIETECERDLPTTLRSEINALLQDYNDWLDVGRAGWTDKKLNKAAKDVESAIFRFREAVIDGKFLPDHPEGVGTAAVQFASRARQAGYLAMLEAEYLRSDAGSDTADSRIEELDRQAGEHLRMLGFRPVDFRVAVAETDKALQKLLASITPLIEFGARSPERSHPEIEARRQFVKGLTQVLEQHDLPTDVSEHYPDKSLFLRLFKALGFGETLKARGRKPRDEDESRDEAIAKSIIRDRHAPN